MQKSENAQGGERDKNESSVGISAKFVRSTGGLNPSIEVRLSDGIERTWWMNTISGCAVEATPNERKSVIALLEKEIDSFETGDCPTAFREMLRDLKDFGGMRK